MKGIKNFLAKYWLELLAFLVFLGTMVIISGAAYQTMLRLGSTDPRVFEGMCWICGLLLSGVIGAVVAFLFLLVLMGLSIVIKICSKTPR